MTMNGIVVKKTCNNGYKISLSDENSFGRLIFIFAIDAF